VAESSHARHHATALEVEWARWLVVSDCGDHEVLVRDTVNGIVARRADNCGHDVVVCHADGARIAVTRIASRNGWGVQRILSPTERTEVSS